jgi:hypothetical protein
MVSLIFGVGGRVHLDVMLSDPDRIAVMQSCALYPQIVDKGAVQAVQVFHHQASGLEIDAGVIIRYRKVIYRQIIVG